MNGLKRWLDLKRCLDKRGAWIKEANGLKRCLYKRGAWIKEVNGLKRRMD